MKSEERTKYYEILDWYADLERKRRGDDLVPSIRERMASYSGTMERIAFFQVLGWELMKQARFEEAAKVLSEWSVLDPTDPFPLIDLASQRLFFEDNPRQALEDIDQAIVIAQSSGNFRRHALNTKARVLLKLKDYRALETCLIEIADTKILPEQLDIGRERDFFDRVPEGAISDEVRNMFLEYLA